MCEVQGAVLSAMGVKDAGQKAIIWTMMDRVDKDSSYKPFWCALPQELQTGQPISSCFLATCH